MTSKILPSAERVRELLHYDPETGLFTWRANRRGVRLGDVAGSLTWNGYWAIGIDGRSCRSHRLAWLHAHGVWPTNDIDHINGQRADNRLSNLREATRQQNCHNVRGPSSNNKSGFLGTSWHKASGKWRATIMANGKLHFLGLFTSAEEAHAEYLRAKQVLHPFNTLMVEN